MDTNTLMTQVKNSNLLTEKERMFWLGSIPDMKPEQMEKLSMVLAEASQLPWTEQLFQYMSALA